MTSIPAKQTSRATKKQREKQLSTFARICVHFGAIIPLLYLYNEWYSYRLIDEVNEITRFTGSGGIIFLMLTLAITPVIAVTGKGSILNPLRKTLGMYAFWYILVHLLVFVVPIAQLSLSEAVTEVLRKRYALVGFIGFLFMVPLAITSNKYSIRKLKRKWKTLHKLIYATGVLAVVHYFWLVKAGAYREPFIFAVILAGLFLLRVPSVKKWIVTKRKSIVKQFKK